MEYVRRRILVVDDEEMIAQTLRIALADEGDVECAGNGREAIKKVAEAFYDVLVVDMNMPVMSGMEFYKDAVKTFPEIRDRIIFFTGACEERCLSFFRENNLRYVAKSSELKELKDFVKEILDRNNG